MHLASLFSQWWNHLQYKQIGNEVLKINENDNVLSWKWIEEQNRVRYTMFIGHIEYKTMVRCMVDMVHGIVLELSNKE